jgi:uncharacterized delta-60 repeat protein
MNARMKTNRRPQLEPLEGRALLSGGGSLDTTFNGSGIQTASLLTATNATAVQADGKMLVVGDGVAKQGNWNYRAVGITRFNPDGSLDTSFGSAGLVTILQGYGATGIGVSLQPDGKILIAGMTYKNSGYDDAYLVARLTPNGGLDKTFATNGVFVWNPTTGAEHALSVAALPDGSIAVGGVANPDEVSPTPSSFTAFMLTSAGKLVTTFGTKGEFRYNFGGGGRHGTTSAMAIAPNGDIILAGRSAIPANDPRSAQGYAFGAVVAVTPSGRLDPAFNGTGVLEVAPPGGSNSSGYLSFGDVAVQGNKVLVSGGFSSALGGGAIVSRYSLAGALDTGFGSGGSVTAPGVDGFGLALAADGSIVVGGSRVYETITYPDGSTTDHHEMVVAHLTADGAIDTGFGTLGTGFVYVRPDVDTGITDLAVGPGGTISACGSRYLIRLTAPA